MVNVTSDFQDYDDDDPNIEFRRARVKYWCALKVLGKEFADIEDSSQWENFVYWVENKYGFKVIFHSGNEPAITDMYTITDEAKFVFFKLKYL